MNTKSKNIVIVGGNGFIGTNLVSSLVGLNFYVKVFVRHRDRAKHLWPLPRTEIIEYENSVTSLSKLLPETDLIINLVGVLQSKRGAPWGNDFEKAHVQLIKNLVKAASEVGCNNFIHISALGSDKNAPSMYLRSKAESERILRESNLKNVIILRPSVVFGPGDKFLTMFAKMHRFLPFIPLASHSSLFQPIYVGDLIRIIKSCIQDNCHTNKTYDCVGPEVFSLDELVNLAGTLSNRKKIVIPLPDTMGRIQALLMEIIPGPTLLSRDNLDSASIPNVSQNPKDVFPLSNPTDVKSIATEYLNA